MTKTGIVKEFGTSGFFVLRTPLLPYEELEAWSVGLQAPDAEHTEHLPAALEKDRLLLRQRLLKFSERPEVREAIFTSSPALSKGLEAWRRDPKTTKGQMAEESLVRYLLRMVARCTPFGLVSGCSLGHVGSTTDLRLNALSTYQRHTRPDMHYLHALTEDLGRLPEFRQLMRYRPNSSLYRAANRLRYAEAHLKDKARIYQLVAIDTEDYEDAWEFINELIDSQCLVTDFSPPVTGREPLHYLIQQLDRHPSLAQTGKKLKELRSDLVDLDRGGLGADPEKYYAIARSLEKLPTEVDLPKLFQVDMIKPMAAATVGTQVVDEIKNGIDWLHRLSGQQEDDELAGFRREFLTRFQEGQAVPLVNVLDEEVGIGYQRSTAPRSGASPLLEGFAIPPPSEIPTVAWGPRAALLLKKRDEAIAAGAFEIELTREDMAVLAAEELPLLPDSFYAVATLAANSQADLNCGNFQVHLQGGAGPSGARLLARFCHADDALCRAVKKHLREEEKLEPSAVYAEIVHLPQGRVGNVLLRPVMRDHEIPFLAQSGIAEDRQIPITDLLVSVVRGDVILTSKKLGCRVIPRLSSAHNVAPGNLGVYRFLWGVQIQGVRSRLYWDWGVLGSLPFVPRVRSGRVVLAQARWWVTGAEIKELAREATAARYRAVRKWRMKRGIPQQALMVQGDKELLVDFNNVLNIDSFLFMTKKLESFGVEELFPAPDQLCVTAPEGRFFHEMVVPFVRKRISRETKPPATIHHVQRSFPPGSEWLYAKLYTGTSTADLVLCDAMGPVIREAIGAGVVDSWFFIRHGDPEWHLRLRFHGNPQCLQEVVLPRLQESAAPLLDDGRIWKFQLETYEREVERYGGAEGIQLAEQLFYVDSDAAMAIIKNLEGAEGAAARWQLTLRSIDILISDLGFEGKDKLEILKRIQSSYALEFNAGRELKKQLADRLRRHRPVLESLLDREDRGEQPLRFGFEALDRRSEQLVPIVSELRTQEVTGKLTVPLTNLAMSFVHMSANRLLRSEARAHELLIYDFLYRLRKSRAIRDHKEG